MRTYNQYMCSSALSESNIQCMRIIKRTLAGIMEDTAAEMLRDREGVIARTGIDQDDFIESEVLDPQ